MDANQLGRRNLTPDAFKWILGRRYNRTKKADGQRGPKKLDQNEPASTAAKLAKRTMSGCPDHSGAGILIWFMHNPEPAAKTKRSN